MKKLYLHVGCGKTGSSALQVWLSHISGALEKQGIIYPLHNRKPLGDYTISSGNGTNLHRAIRNHILERYFRNLELEKSSETLLYSSEVFQNLTEEDSVYLKKVAKENGFEVHIIAYARDVYDMTYSSYQQMVKRHTCTQPFLNYALGRKNLQQFSVIGKLSQWFENTHVIHYDSVELGDISKPFSRLIGIDTASVPEMTKNKVNRSLTVLETELMLLANRIYMQSHNEPSMRFSASLSDQLIALCPERETEILFDQKVFDHFSAVMQEHVNVINAKYFNQPLLQIFREKGKNIVTETPVLSEDLKRFISILIVPHLEETRPKARFEKWARILLRQ